MALIFKQLGLLVLLLVKRPHKALSIQRNRAGIFTAFILSSNLLNIHFEPHPNVKEKSL